MGEIYNQIVRAAWMGGVRPVVGEIRQHNEGLPFHLNYPNGWLALPPKLIEYLGGYFYPIRFPRNVNPPTYIDDLQIIRVDFYKCNNGQFIEVFRSLVLPTHYGTRHEFIQQFFLWRENDEIPEFVMPEFYSGVDEEFDF